MSEKLLSFALLLVSAKARLGSAKPRQAEAVAGPKQEAARLDRARRSPEQAGRSISGLWMYDTCEAQF